MGKNYVAKQGDCIASIAFRFGYTIDSIWNASENQQLKNLRSSPYQLMPGDRVYLPDKVTREETAQTGQRSSFKRKGYPEFMTLVFQDDEGNPRSDEDCVVVLDGHHQQERTDTDGQIRVAISPKVRSGRVMFTQTGEMFDIAFGHLDPIETVSGQQARLQNLGFYTGVIDGDDGVYTRAARTALTGNEEPQNAIDSLRDVHGS